MRFLTSLVCTLFLFMLQPALSQPAMAQSNTSGVDLDNFLYLKLKTGLVIIKLNPEKAPSHVARVRKLARAGFYDGLKFHRVIDGFMAQTGDPTGTGAGGSQFPDLKAEFSNLPFNRGTIGAARTNNPHSANSQFFICYQAASHLNGIYTVWGKVVYGMEHVDRIKKGLLRGGMVSNPDKIINMVMAGDAQYQPPVSLRRFVQKDQLVHRRRGSR